MVTVIKLPNMTRLASPISKEAFGYLICCPLGLNPRGVKDIPITRQHVRMYPGPKTTSTQDRSVEHYGSLLGPI